MTARATAKPPSGATAVARTAGRQRRAGAGLSSMAIAIQKPAELSVTIRVVSAFSS
ncbi:MAG TPA: hypothetical protein VGI64_11500 [Streptosporangiaceae bacterium]